MDLASSMSKMLVLELNFITLFPFQRNYYKDVLEENIVNTIIDTGFRSRIHRIM